MLQGRNKLKTISPTTLEAAAILTKVIRTSQLTKGRDTREGRVQKNLLVLDFEEVKSAFEKVNTGGIKVSSSIEEINTGSLDVKTGIDPRRKALMTEEKDSTPLERQKNKFFKKKHDLRKLIRLDALEQSFGKGKSGKQVQLDSLIAQRMPEEQRINKRNKRKGSSSSV
ncbi:hypothetical protein Tco_0070826 [Tanacetum coccineum]